MKTVLAWDLHGGPSQWKRVQHEKGPPARDWCNIVVTWFWNSIIGSLGKYYGNTKWNALYIIILLEELDYVGRHRYSTTVIGFTMSTSSL